jgi:hypothetical protein
MASDPPRITPQLDASTAASLRLNRLLVQCVKDYAIFLLAPNRIVRSWNVAEEIIGQHFSKLYPPEDRARDKRAYEHDTGRPGSRFALTLGGAQ